MILIKASTASQPAYFNDEYVFSANDFVNVLSQIKELKQVHVALIQPEQHGRPQLIVGDYQYQL